MNAIGTQMCDPINYNTVIGTDPMVVDDIDGRCRRKREEPAFKHEIQSGFGE